MPFTTGVLSWDLDEISRSLRLSPKDVRIYFTDGRRVSFILERRLAYEVLKGKLAPSEGAGYDLIDEKGQRWEVRSVTRGGIYFCPSYMVGSGRAFEESGFLTKLEEVAGYIISDVEGFPIIPYWIVPKETIRKWYDRGLLGAGTKISRSRALQLLSS
ncbi:MAG: hypothetical protein HYY78_07135 [Betaproteobacteria bacterium]|nr:hypothetical protein [Betaproteobacteria bacterium]